VADDTKFDDPAHRRALAERAFRALATAQLRREDFESAQAHLLAAHARAQHLRTDYIALWQELERTIVYVAQGERFSGKPPEHMLVLLKQLVDESGMDRDLRREIETDVLRWGIDAYYAA
jgi:hypothetical protein